MTTDETDYAILTAHSKMAAATPPCVQLLAVRFPCTERFLRGRGQKMADVTSTQKMQQIHTGPVKNRSQCGAMIQRSKKCGATAGTRNSCRYNFKATLRGVVM